MPILDLAGAKPLEGYKPARKRTLGAPGTVPAGLLNGGNGGAFAAARVNRLTMDFLAGNTSADQALYSDNRLMRARARYLATNHPHARKFLWMWNQNVVGPKGVQMKSKVTNASGNETGATDLINKRIEKEWKRWCKKGRCTADGKFDFVQYQQMVAKNIPREGENLVKWVYGMQFNDTGIALQPLDNDQLDDTMMMEGSNGSQIRMGVEVSQYQRPQAYWLFKGHPNDILSGSRERERIPADRIIHTAMWERPGQTRGYTWMSSVILSMNQHGGWAEASLVAARASAAKFMIVEEKAADDGYVDEDEAGADLNSDGTQMMSANAGEALVLDPGQEAKFIDPRFPMNTYKEFAKACLMDISSGLLVSYPSLASDLEGVNFSSIRAGLIDERDMWRICQRFFINDFCEPVRQGWLRMALLTTLSDITLTPDQMEQVSWNARGWEWVDPQKDAAATILKLGEGLTTYEREAANLGHDWQEDAIQRKKEQDFFDEIGVVYGVDISGDQGGKGVAADDESAVAKEGGGAAGGGKPQAKGGK